MKAKKLVYDRYPELLRKAYGQAGRIVEADGANFPVCSFPTSNGSPEQIKNLTEHQKVYVDLFCAAPDMLEVLEHILEHLKQKGDISTPMTRDIEKVIKKAKGNG